MVPDNLQKYVRKCLELGKTPKEITGTLLDKGWDANIVELALDEGKREGSFIPKKDEERQFTYKVKDEKVGKLKFKNSIATFFAGVLDGSRKFRASLVALGLAIIASVYPVTLVFTVALPFIDRLQERVEIIVDEVFPEELEITIEDGKASSNVTEPYHLTVSLSTFQTCDY
jgi:hypothetical protein